MGRKPKYDREIMARAIAEWAAFGYKTSAADQLAHKYGVATTTIYRWRKEITHDPESEALHRQYVTALLQHDWTAQLNTALTEAITRIRELIIQSNDLPAVTDAFKALSEIAVAREVLNVTTDDRPNDATQENRARKQSPTSATTN